MAKVSTKATSSVRFSDDDLARLDRIKKRTGIDKLATILRNALEAYETQLDIGPPTAAQQEWLRKTIRAEVVSVLDERARRRRLAVQAVGKRRRRRRSTTTSK